MNKEEKKSISCRLLQDAMVTVWGGIMFGFLFKGFFLNVSLGCSVQGYTCAHASAEVMFLDQGHHIAPDRA